MNMTIFLATVLQLCLIQHLEAAKILFLYLPAYSHYTGSLNLMTELASRGHGIWNALPTSLANDKRLKVPGVNNLIYESLDNYDIEKHLVDDVVETFFQNTSIPVSFENTRKICDVMLRDTALFLKLRSLNPDLIVLDNVPIGRMLTIFAYKLDVPFVFIGAAFSHISVEVYAPEKPYISLESLMPKALIWIIEIEPFLHYPQATLPNVKLIGSLSTNDPKPLPEVYKKFMDEAKEGVVIVSFGSSVKHLPTEISKKLLNAFHLTKYKFIFKTDMEKELGSKVLLTKWMPQSDLLAHPNTKLFITHCGANGQYESFLRGVPMIGFPMFAEQHFNAERIAFKGFGVKMELRDFTVDELVANINLVIQNVSYAKKIKKAAEITKLRHRTPKEEAVYWIEHVLQYGGEHLRSYCQDMPLYQYLNLDVIGLLLFLFYLIVFLIWKLFGLCIRKICHNTPGRKAKLE